MLLEMASLQSMLVDRCDDFPQKNAKRGSNRLKLLVEGIAQNILVHIPQEVNQALLSRTVYSIVGGIKVRDQNPFEILEHIFKETALTRRPVQKYDFLETGEHPNIASPVLQLHLGFIDVQDGT